MSYTCTIRTSGVQTGSRKADIILLQALLSLTRSFPSRQGTTRMAVSDKRSNLTQVASMIEYATLSACCLKLFL